MRRAQLFSCLARLEVLLPEEDDAHEGMAASESLWGAVRTVIVADVVMSLDNVIAVAGAAHGDITLVVFGILVSVPIIVWGSRFVLKLMDRFPVVITLGGALLGWIAGGMAVSDGAVTTHLGELPGWLKYACGALGAVLVVAVGKWLAHRQARRAEVIEISLDAPDAAPRGKQGGQA